MRPAQEHPAAPAPDIEPTRLPEAPPGFPHAPRLYLDQFVWIKLNGPDSRTRRLRERLTQAVDRGQIVVCLSGSHYVETWHRGDWCSRWTLARAMWDTSRLVTLAPLHALTLSEIASSLTRHGFQVPEGLTRTTHVGLGVNHAFASTQGRLPVEDHQHAAEDPDKPRPPLPLTPESWHQAGDLAYEWLSLAGPAGDIRDYQVDWDAEERQAVSFVEQEVDLARYLTERGARPLEHALALDALSTVEDDLIRVCRASGIPLEQVLDGDPAHLHAFMRTLPTFGLLQALRVKRHQNPQKTWAAHDRQDLLALSVAAVHCDAVVTEAFWADNCRKVRVPADFGTHVGASLDVALATLGA